MGALMRATAGIPAIAPTAYARLEDAERALEAGFQQHVAKPIESTLLVDAVQRLVQDAH